MPMDDRLYINWGRFQGRDDGYRSSFIFMDEDDPAEAEGEVVVDDCIILTYTHDHTWRLTTPDALGIDFPELWTHLSETHNVSVPRVTSIAEMTYMHAHRHPKDGIPKPALSS